MKTWKTYLFIAIVCLSLFGITFASEFFFMKADGIYWPSNHAQKLISGFEIAFSLLAVISILIAIFLSYKEGYLETKIIVVLSLLFLISLFIMISNSINIDLLKQYDLRDSTDAYDSWDMSGDIVDKTSGTLYTQSEIESRYKAMQSLEGIATILCIPLIFASGFIINPITNASGKNSSFTKSKMSRSSNFENSLDNLVKAKKLLDTKVITQKEFDVIKKRELNL